MKKMVVVMVALVLAFALAGCGSSRSSQPSSSNEAAGSQYYDVAIVGSETVTDSQGGQAIVVAFDYTNKTSTPVSFMQAVPTAASQDGVTIGQDAYVTGYVGTDGVTPDYMLKVEPGATATVHMAFAMTSMNEVTVRCSLGYVDGTYPDSLAVLAEAVLQP